MKKTVAILMMITIWLTICACIHQHTWSEATCTKPKTCTACGATEGTAKGHTWSEATCTKPKTCTACGATEGTAKGHTWSEATYKSPKTCSSCWATEGSPKQSFFEKNKIPVNDKLRGFTAKGAIKYDNYDPPRRTEQISIKYSVKTYTIVPSKTRSNYNTVAIIIEAPLIFSGAKGAHISTGSLVDYYTGYKFADRSTENDETVNLYDSVSIDGKKYTLYYARDIQWEETNQGVTATATFVVDIPENYDGLVLRFVDIDVDCFDDEDDFDVSSGYLEDDVEKGYNFRIGND